MPVTRNFERIIRCNYGPTIRYIHIGSKRHRLILPVSHFKTDRQSNSGVSFNLGVSGNDDLG